MIDDENWMIETDGTALASILNQKHIDPTKTVSNDNIEILNILGVEASRQSLINELRFVLSSYGIYVNYRHISTLVDVMSHRGKLTSITRHGINRVERGQLPLLTTHCSNKHIFAITLWTCSQNNSFSDEDEKLDSRNSTVNSQ